MALICDTSGVYALDDTDDDQHDSYAAASWSPTIALWKSGWRMPRSWLPPTG